MENKITFINGKCDSNLFDVESNTLTLNENKTFYLEFVDGVPSPFNLKIENANVTIIENYKGKVNDYHYVIDVLKDSSLNRLAIFADNTSNVKAIKDVNNYGFYQSMQIDLNENDLNSVENINMVEDESSALIIDGIHAIKDSNKKYQTNINHYGKNCHSQAKIFAINNDNAHVSIYTDAYIKSGAIGTNTTQEGRIINLSDTCSGIVLPNLHIDENDVVASHSCSVGSVNKDHMYYLQSRGFSELQARNVLILGYFNPLLKNINDETIKNELDKVLKQRIG